MRNIHRTPLHACVETRSLEAVEFLVANGANPNQKDDGIFTDIFMGFSYFFLIVLRYI